MKEGAIEETQIPRNPLDVLGQQVVAIASQEEIEVDELLRLVNRAYPFADLSRVQLENVLDMLAGRYPSDEFAELRPRIAWGPTPAWLEGAAERLALLLPTPGRSPTAGCSASTSSTAVAGSASLDEEMVYEARAGQTFMLGASTWRIEEITRDRVLVSPAPGVPGAILFWKGEGPGPAVRARRGDRQGVARAGVPLRRTGG